MSPVVIILSAHVLATGLALSAIVTAGFALGARSLVAMCLGLAATGACAAGAVMALGASDASLGLALIGAALAPIFLLAGVSLSARAAKSHKRGPVIASAIAGVAVGAAVMIAAPELGAVSTAVVWDARGSVAPWLAALVFVAAISVLASLGHGERGAFAREDEP